METSQKMKNPKFFKQLLINEAQQKLTLNKKRANKENKKKVPFLWLPKIKSRN
jgi:hypothetical protein